MDLLTVKMITGHSGSCTFLKGSHKQIKKGTEAADFVLVNFSTWYIA